VDDTIATIEMLSADMRDEHAAIIQYLQHAYALGESGEACEIEAIARDEMRHFDWLAEAIVELGGKPDLDRAAVDLSGSLPAERMARDVAAEERAISQYRDHIERIADPKIKRLLGRILSDEESHRADFTGIAAELAEEPTEGPIVLAERTAAGAHPHDVDILQAGIEHEYSVILQYLYHDFVMPECEVGRELEMQAINEMQHLGWLSEELVEIGGHPRIEHTGLSLEGSSQEMLEADIEAENAVAATYTRHIEQLENEELKPLLTRIRDHEIYHEEVFQDLAAELHDAGAEGAEADSPPEPEGHSFTVGSLIKD